MSGFFASIGHNLRGLFRFSGRDARSQFWPYAILLIFLDMVAMMGMIMPAVMDSLARMQRFAAVHPELTTVESGPGHYSISIEGYHPELMPDMGRLGSGFALIVLATVLLLAAAVTRRLHDRDRRGWWGALPVPFLAFGVIAMPRVMTGFQARPMPDMRLFFALFLNNMIYFGALVLVVVLLAGPGTGGPNRFDDPGGS
ncbi:MAG TPA: DUF805 domain-containing protein [Allosphingosinicella sp.]